ncbi:MAG: J domain-containing protein, partial [Bacteroidota bacterium]
MDSAGHYAVLGLGPSATAAEIRKAYHRLALRHHPDTNPNDASAAERFRRVAEAYRILSDPELRASYDADAPDVPAPAYLVCEVDRMRV